jgi:hypothetical protein
VGALYLGVQNLSRETGNTKLFAAVLGADLP